MTDTQAIELNCRNDFPALRTQMHGRKVIYLDGPGGTQVPQRVIDAIADYYRSSNANTHGYFQTSANTDEVIHKARVSMAVFLGAEGPETISIGQNMTTLNFSLSHALGRKFSEGDEVLITQLDHEANRGPWLGLARYGVEVKEVRLLESGNLDYEDFADKITPRTKLVAVGWASNALGTVNDVNRVVQMAKSVGALVVVDAVHYAPHFDINVKELGCDFLLCSAYKFYGPHLGFLYSKPGLLDRLDPDRLRTQSQTAPFRIETGTLNHAALAGTVGAIEYLAEWGEGSDLSAKIRGAKAGIQKHERGLAKRLFDGLIRLPGLRVYGKPFESGLRAPTISFTLDQFTPATVCEFLARRGICCWDGHFYAIRAIECLGLVERGGVTRMGISMYNNEEEIDYTIRSLEQLLESVPAK